MSSSNNNNKLLHIPVLLDQMIETLAPIEDGIYVDGTFGRGGYTKEILKTKGTRVIAIDRDPDAIAEGRRLEVEYKGRLAVIEGRFSKINEAIQEGLTVLDMPDDTESVIDGIVFDIGVSSPQLDDKSRGFSFNEDAPLDMRMERNGKTAADLVNNLPEEELATLIYLYGEERKSRQIAHRIILQRQEKPIETTLELSNLVQSVLKKAKFKSGQKTLHPATRTFQALRIAVNEELHELELALDKSVHLLKNDGRLVVVTFHSLEDRIVKNFFRLHSGHQEGLSRHDPRAAALPHQNDNHADLTILTRKALKAREDEIIQNPRARSAKLRAAKRCMKGVVS